MKKQQHVGYFRGLICWILKSLRLYQELFYKTFKLKKKPFATSHLQEFIRASPFDSPLYFSIIIELGHHKRFSFSRCSSQSDIMLVHLLHWEQADAITKAWNCFKGFLTRSTSSIVMDSIANDNIFFKQSHLPMCH